MTSNKSTMKNRTATFISVIPKILVVALVLLTVSFSAKGHVAPTDENGCHYDYNGRYHCH